MKRYTKIITAAMLLLLSVQSKAQWVQNSLTGDDIFMMRYINGNFFAYGYNLSTNYGGLYISTDKGVTWKNDDSAIFTSIRVTDMTYDTVNSVYILVAEAQDGVYYSPDGLTWTNSGTNWNGNAITYIHQQDALSLEGGIGISTDGGKSWSASNTGLPGPFYVHEVTRINDTLYLANQGDPCFISTNYGASWVDHSDSNDYFMDCFFEHQGIVYSGLYLNGVTYYINGHWNVDTIHLPASEDIWALSDAGDTLFCGGDSIGVWMNVTGAWQDFSNGLPAKTNVTKLLNISNKLFAGTYNGIWQQNLATNTAGITNVANNNNVEVYPSLTNGNTTIYSESTPKTVSIIDLQGRTLQTFTNTKVVDLSNLSQGIYFLNIIFPTNEVVVKKVVRE